MNATIAEPKIEFTRFGYRAPWKERFRVWRSNWKNRHVAKALKTLTEAMQKDPSFAHTWHCNIAMPIYDATRPKCYCGIFERTNGGGGHLGDCFIANPSLFGCRDMPIKQANHIAEKLMLHLFGVKNSSQHK